MLKQYHSLNGVQRVAGVNSLECFLALARKLGKINRGIGGSLVERIYPRDVEAARPGSFGAEYGKGAYPLHTDTAHWPAPVRLVLLRVVGDTRRPTVFCRVSDFLNSLTEIQLSALKSSVWYSGFGDRCFTCSLLFRMNSEQVFRFDPQCMRPANGASQSVVTWLPEVMEQHTASLEWRKDEAIVLHNWRVLHGRGHQPNEEGYRELQRIYVE